MKNSKRVRWFPTYRCVITSERDVEDCRETIRNSIRPPNGLLELMDQPTSKLIGEVHGFTFSGRPLTGAFLGRSRPRFYGVIEASAKPGSQVTVSVEPIISNWIVLPVAAWFYVGYRSASSDVPFNWALGILLTLAASALAAIAHIAEGSSIQSAVEKIVAPMPPSNSS